MKILKIMQKGINSILLSVIGGLLALIAWGGNNYYQDQKDYNIQRDREMKNINESQIIIKYRVKTLEKLHDNTSAEKINAF